MPTVDYYEILGVKRDASGDEIKRAYRKLARTHHPDVSHDKAEAEHRFKEINEAYEILSDPRKRAHYDRFGTSGAAGFDGAGGFGSGFGDIFDMFFGDMRGATGHAPRSAPARGSDLRYDLEITLEEAFAGTTKDISFSHLAQCATCKGSGAAPGSLIVPCERCNGSGVVRHVRQTPLGQFVTQSACTSCAGEGQKVARPCQTCGGSGRHDVERELSVKVPAGVDDGSRIRINGSGEAGTRGGASGDLYVYLRIPAHPIFRRDGSDTFVDLPIAFSQAALGATVEAPSLEGALSVTIPPGTQSGTTLRLQGRGMPTIRGTQRGDHHVTVRVLVPTRISKRQRELLEEYAREGGDSIDDKSFLERVKDAFNPE